MVWIQYYDFCCLVTEFEEELLEDKEMVMSEKYRLIKHNKNLAEIENDRGVGLLFLVDEDCERKLEIIVDLLNKLYEENEQLKKSEKINMEYAEQIVEENQQLRIAKNDLRIENEQLHLAIDDLLSHTW